MGNPILLFDVMGTLVRDPFFVEMPAFFCMTFSQMLERKEPTAWLEFERNEIDETTFLSRFFVDHAPFDHGSFMDAVEAGYRWIAGVEEILAELRARGTDVHAFSNYPVWYQRIEKKLELSRYLPWSFVSCKTGLRKPDPAAYEYAVRALSAAPERCVFIDDRENNCDAARQVGMRAIRFVSGQQLRDALVQIDLL